MTKRTNRKRNALRRSDQRRNRRADSRTGSTRKQLNLQSLEKRELLAAEFGPRLISVAANSGQQFELDEFNPITSSPKELTFRFDGGQEIDAATLSSFRFTASGGDGDFTDGDEVLVTPGSIGLGESSRIVVARFGQELPDDQYRLSIAGFDDSDAGIQALRNVDGATFVATNPADPSRPSQDIFFDLEVGPKVVAIVPQPITGTGVSRDQARDQIEVYFNDDLLNTGAAENTDFYQLYATAGTVETQDDQFFTPDTAVYDSDLNRVTLTFVDDLENLPGVLTDGSATFRLRVGSSELAPATLANQETDLTVDAADTFAQANDTGLTFGGRSESVTLKGTVEAPVGNTIQWPGIDAPYVREDRRDAQVVGRADTQDGVNTYFYNFADLYGSDAIGNNLENAITPAQQQRVREILDLYSEELGVRFIETEDSGLQFVTGDLRALVETATTGPGLPFQEFRVNDADPSRGVLILDAGENWFDGYGLSPNDDPSYFVEALRGVGSLLGIGNTFEQVPGVASGSEPSFNVDNQALDSSDEPDFLSTSDIIPGQALHRPEIKDVDLYRFEVSEAGRLSIESFAERLIDLSGLDSDLKLWKLNPSNGEYDLVARNDDFYGEDSFIGIDVSPNANGTDARYVIGITAKGNDQYNPNIAGTGGGGRSSGDYELRLNFERAGSNTIVDTTGSRLDGDSDGKQGGNFDFWFRVAPEFGVPAIGEPRTLFVNKTDGNDNLASGSLANPLQSIEFALSQAQPGDIVRLLPDAGADGLVGTTADNRAYEIGRDSGGNAHSDGEFFDIPRGVTVMIDAGAILKLQNAKIGVGSETIDEDRSLAALQVLGTPVYVDSDGTAIDGGVDLTSIREESRGGVRLGQDNNPLSTTPTAGDWGGIEFRNDVDYSEGRLVYETEGAFIDYVSHADIRYGGGSVTSNDPIVTPIQLNESRPTLIYNDITFSSDAAISADPDSFLETNFHAPLYQQASLDRFGALFTSDFERVGPLVRGNDLRNNSINGLFVRIDTPAGGEREAMTVSGRFDDADITHVLSEVLVLQGSPGGDILLEDQPDVLSTVVSNGSPSTPGTLTNGDIVDYIVTFVTEDGFESRGSVATTSIPVDGSGSVALSNLPVAGDGFSSRRIYRRTIPLATGIPGMFTLVASLDRVTTTFLDDGSQRGGELPAAALAPARLLPRTEARLSIDPGLVVKLDSARIEVAFGADFYAEGTDGKPVVFTSRQDDRFGAGASFDLTNDGNGSAVQPNKGDWGGLIFRQGSTASLDYATIAFAGGESATDGGFTQFNAVEILQADVRIANSTISDNDSGYTGTTSTRDGIGFNRDAAIFVRGSQPILFNNTITDNDGAAISINPDSLSYVSVADMGRSTGEVDRFITDVDNQGPLIEANRLDGNFTNGLIVRSEPLTTESVWDDTDIVHVVELSVTDYNHHHRGGLRLKSDTNQSLVVKLNPGGTLSSTRPRSNFEDALGGRLQILGQPGFPVILTSLSDSTVGAGFTPDGVEQTNTDGPIEATPAPGDWFGLSINSGSNDRNVAFVAEFERAVPTAAGQNAIANNAQILGSLAQDEKSADENRRLGFEVRGALSQVGDVDVYMFKANGGTEVFIDIDDTNFDLDTVVELIDGQDNILAISNSSFAESNNPSLLVNNLNPGDVLPLRKTGEKTIENPNPLDAGMRVLLPGNTGTENEYFVRVRSSNARPGDTQTQIRSRLQNESLVGAGLSSGQYSLALRLQETDEISGSTVRLADIRYAFEALRVPSAVNSSPLTAETAERLTEAGIDINDGAISFNGTEGSASFANNNADPVGNISITDRGVLRTSGVLGNNVLPTDPQFAELSELDIDVYRVDLVGGLQEPNIIGENRFISTIFDVDYADQLGRANTSLAVFTADGRLILHSRDSNIADDQGRPTEGLDQTNLSAGSAGTLDAYIGPVELQVGTYYVVVSSAQMIPESLNQLFQANPAEDRVRIYPVDSTRRIAEVGFDEGDIDVNSYFGSEFAALNRNAELPDARPLFDETSIVPFKLEDVPLFLTLDGGLSGNNRSTLVSIDPFSATLSRTIGQFAQPVNDLAIREDGELFAYSLGPANGQRTVGNAGNFLNISSDNAAAGNDGDDGLIMRRNNMAGGGTEADPNAEFQYTALTFDPPSGSTGLDPTVNNPTIPDGDRGLSLGFRDTTGRGGEIPTEYTRNILYSFRANNGQATNFGSLAANTGRFDQNRNGGPYNTSLGPVGDRFELGVIDIGQFPDSVDPIIPTLGAQHDLTGIAIDPIFGRTQTYGVTDSGYVFTFNGNGSDTRPSADGNYNQIINSTNHGLVTPDPDDLVSVANGFVRFTGMTLGPRYTESGLSRAGTGPYAQTIFATTAEGWLYTLQLEDDGINPVTVEPAYVLKDGHAALPITLQSGALLGRSPNGAAFSTREETAWHQTLDRGNSVEHGIDLSHNQSRIPILGGDSLYFGFESSVAPTNPENNSLSDSAGSNGVLSPGGTKGTVISRPFSLEDYNFGDKPTLYYNYFLEVSNGSEYISPNRAQTDSFRAYAAGDDGQWRLLATNNSWRSFSDVPTSDEFDYFGAEQPDGTFSGIPVQEHFENTNTWRQARVDLSPLAGHKNIQIRFDFSTAGAISDSFLFGEGTELQAVEGTDIVEGTGFTVQPTTGGGFGFGDPSVNFEFVRGAQVALPDPATIPDGQEIRVLGDNGPIVVRLVTGPVTAGNELTIIPDREILANQIATLLNTLEPSLAAQNDTFYIRIPEALDFELDPPLFENAGTPQPTDSQYLPSGSVPVFYHEDMGLAEVRDALRDALARGLGNRDLNGVSTATIVNYPEFGTNRIRLQDKTVLFNDSRLGVNEYYPGDEFGAYGSNSVSTGGINVRPVSDNAAVEGVYLDDIVIGFAERGETVYNAPVNRNFDVLPETRTFTFTDSQQPEFGNEILVGDYTLEVRHGAEYGVPEDNDPIRLGLDEQLGFGRSFDTNDRFGVGATLIAPSSSEVADGDVFVLSNGTKTATFEFTADGTVAQGRVAVPLVSLVTGSGYLEDENDSAVLASAIRDAINSPQVRNVLGIRAAGADGTETGLQASNRIELFSDDPNQGTFQVNPSPGRFVQIDMVAEETFYGREGARTLPEVDHDGQTVVDTISFDTFAQATVTDYINGDTDTLVATGKIGDNVGTDDANVLIPTDPSADLDIVKIYLEANNRIDVDIDTAGLTKGTLLANPEITIYDESFNLLAISTLGSLPGEFADGAFIDNFLATTSGYYYVVVGSQNFFGFSTGFGEYQLTIRPNTLTSAGTPITSDPLMVDYHTDFGDLNVFRPQGQLIIDSNFIRDYQNIGINASASDFFGDDNDADFGFPIPIDRRPGGATTLRNVNSDRLVPGTIISNNVVVSSAGTAIRFAGENTAGGDSPTPVPFGRIVNNTVVGDGTGTGILLEQSVSPTVLNNLVVDFATGINVADDSSTSILNGNAYQLADPNSATNPPAAKGAAAIDIPAGAQLFQDAAGRIFIPAEGSAVIDSSFASLNDRSSFVNTVKAPVGIASSPILAPEFDAYGIPRFDDTTVNTPGGVGSNVFIDRGAIDRADFDRPEARLVAPIDFVGGGVAVAIAGGDNDPENSFVRLTDRSVEFFEIQLTDPAGSGLDGRTITEETILVTENGRRLENGVDYIFGYSDNSNVIRLTPLAGLWRTDSVYEITLNNQDRIAYQAPAGEDITDGDQVAVTDADSNVTVFEYESGFALVAPQSTALLVDGTREQFNDRDLLTITAPSGNSVTFEFNLVAGVTGGNVPINLQAAGTIAETRNAIFTAMSGNVPGQASQTIADFLDIVPAVVGQNQIQLGDTTAHSAMSTGTGLSVTPGSGRISDGDTFTYETGTESITFAFDNDGTTVDPDAVPVLFSATDTPADIAAAIVAAVQAQPLGLNSAIALPNGTAILGGADGDTLTASTGSTLVVEGSPGVTGGLSIEIPLNENGGSLNDSGFTVTVDGTPVNFRFTTDPNLASPDRLIVVSNTDSAARVADATAIAVADAFPGQLTPVAEGASVTLGESPATSSSPTRVRFTDIDSGVTTSGVSGGAIAVPYLPTGSPTSIAAALQGVLQSSSANVQTFSPGGGTLLFTSADEVQSRSAQDIADGNTAGFTNGVTVLAVSDLAGNRVDNTRNNGETRFTIIMPEVVFDFGDAPIDYPTLLQDNGARHTVNVDRSPRLGNFIDSESDGQPGDNDDTPVIVLSSSPDAALVIDNLAIADTSQIQLVAVPTGGELLEVSVGAETVRYEFVDIFSTASPGNIPITVDTGESIADVREKLRIALAGTLPGAGDNVVVTTANTDLVRVRAIDDEDGVLVATFVDNRDPLLPVPYEVFVAPGTDPTNVSPEDVLGFLNPRDPAGSTVAVNVTGSGLLHAWIDFDGNKQFEPDEQVVTNRPVSGDPVNGSINFITIVTPSAAVDGKTWMRVRISESGNLDATGVAVGGEVEDYEVEIIGIDLPTPDDDEYTILEDSILDTLADNPTPDTIKGVSDGDSIPAAAFLPVQYIVTTLPEFGTLTNFDSTTGEFVYEPLPDFFGKDTFTYRLSTQQNANASEAAAGVLGTVTINVDPVNDAPGGNDATISALEDSIRQVSAAELLATAIGDADPMGQTDLQNEANQIATLRIESISGNGSAITAANAADGGLITVTSGTSGELDLTIPNVSDIISATEAVVVTLAYGGVVESFQLAPQGSSVVASTPVPVLSADTMGSVADRFADAIEDAFSNVTASTAGGVISLTPTASAVAVTGSVSATAVTAGVQVDVPAIVNPTAAPTVDDMNPAIGDTVTVNVDGTPVTFEFLAEGAMAATGNRSVELITFDDPNSAAASADAAAALTLAVKDYFETSSLPLNAQITAGATNPNRILISSTGITAAVPQTTDRGTIVPVFDSSGALLEVGYLSSRDLNRANPMPTVPVSLDELSFIVVDDGVSIDPIGNQYIYGPTATSTPITISVDVKPQNDPPVLNDDFVTAGPIGSPDSVSTTWEIGGRATPTEDTVLTIPTSFLLQNDLQGRVTAADENATGSTTDGSLAVIGVAMDPAFGTVQLQGTEIIFTPADDVYGDVVFTYTARDQGINVDLDDNSTAAPLFTTNGMVTITIQPVNDVPVPGDRTLTFVESADPGPGTPFVFTNNDLIAGLSGETASIPGVFDAGLGVPFNETVQTPGLRVASFTTAAGTVDRDDLVGSGVETLTLASDTGGTYRFIFNNGEFVSGSLETTDDFNQRITATDEFSFTIIDNGLTIDPADANNSFVIERARSTTSATATVIVTETNDAPTFNVNAGLVNGVPTASILERDDNGGTSIPMFLIDILPGPVSATDETNLQNVTFSFPTALNQNLGPFRQLPQLLPNGTLTVYPATDQIGTATFVAEAVDSEPTTTGFAPRTSLVTFAITVRPVNDAPRFDTDAAGSTDSAGPDEAYAVDANSPIVTYTFREDNTLTTGVNGPALSIPMRQGNQIDYNRIGLLDLFTVGPENEADASEGGLQSLEYYLGPDDLASGAPLVRSTDLGGTITAVLDTNGVVTELLYQPPQDLNFDIAGFDTFTFDVIDSSAAGETYDLATGALVSDSMISQGIVQIRLNPVNDAPQFTIESLAAVQEDSSVIQIDSFARSIFAGPPATAFDEIDASNGQLVEFTVTSLSFLREDADKFFAVFPEINEETGRLVYQPAANVFGEFEFEVVLTDRNQDGSQSNNTERGDLISSIPQTMTITVNPVNDPPEVNANAAPIILNVAEDNTTSVPVADLEAVFRPGPGGITVGGGAVDPTDESIVGKPGAGQTVALATPIPSRSAFGGSIELVNIGGVPTLQYTPRENFVGTDSFIYVVTDDGITVGPGGDQNNPSDQVSNPRISSNTVSIEVTPINDVPEFSGAASVTVDEDAGAATITGWATNVRSGPATAADELAEQSLTFEIEQVGTGDNILVGTPTVTINSDGTADLNFETVADASGSITYSVVLVDDGLSTAPDVNRTSPPREFTINVLPINDPPTFVFDGDGSVTVDEDAGPYASVQVLSFSPGPADESDQTVSFTAELADPTDADKFTEPPTIDGTGLLRFVVAPNANTQSGPVEVRITATDSGGAVSPGTSFFLNIAPVNDVPIAISDAFNVDEDSVATFTASQLLASGIDPAVATGDGLTLDLRTPTGSNTRTTSKGAIVTIDPATGNVTYDPSTSVSIQSIGDGTTTTDTFSYRIRDTSGAISNTTNVTLTIAGQNDAPIVRDDAPLLNPDGVTVISILSNDEDIDGTIRPESLEITFQPSFGTVSIDVANQTIVYNPVPGSNIDDFFRYRVADNDGLFSDEATVTLSANIAPVANNDVDGTFRGETVFVNVAGNDTDSDGELDLGSVQIVTPPSRGQAVPQANGTVQYLPNAGFTGTDTFTYTITDLGGRVSNEARVRMQVVASRLQNPGEQSDVNDDGRITPIDSLLVINHLRRQQSRAIPVLESDSGPSYFDVDGNLTITPVDALMVINNLRRLNNSSRGGESVADSDGFQPLSIDTFSPAVLAYQPESSKALAAEIAEFEKADKIADFTIADAFDDDTLNVLAGNSLVAEQASDSDVDTSVSALDAAINDLAVDWNA